MKLGFNDGLYEVLSQIRQYANHIGAHDKYHATLSYALYRLLLERLEENYGEIKETGQDLDIALKEQLSNLNKSHVLEHYTEFTLDSEAAKQSIILPDRRPFDSDSKYEPEPYRLEKGSQPVLISMPHNGTLIPSAVLNTMTDAGKGVADTDWYLRILYDFMREEGCYFITPKYSRYVIDLNRPADGAVLYPGANNTELCPTSTFAFERIYQDSGSPTEESINSRIDAIWRPYHQAIAETLDEIKQIYGGAVLLEAHSIASQVPRFFDGTLPDFNFGTNEGKSCSNSLAKLIEEFETDGYSKVENGRFKGGYITRHYGRPDENISTVQLELSQRCYMDENSLSFNSEKANAVTPVLRNLIVQLKEFVNLNV
ncbi:MAG: N-formylglutamate deformylase [Gammaproteobacteria bacterium]|nr:N-formylglutamate deformylase [Gammaproteobacteria bacterium]